MLPQAFQLAITGFLQVLFVSVNTLFISRTYYEGIAVAAFLISFIWSINVKKVAFGSFWDRVFYSEGAALGSVTGTFFCGIFCNLMHPTLHEIHAKTVSVTNY